MSDAIARAKARIETALESIRGLTYGDHAPSATQRSYDQALEALDTLVAVAERLEGSSLARAITAQTADNHALRARIAELERERDGWKSDFQQLELVYMGSDLAKALDAIKSLERERDEARAERDQWKANVATVGYVMDEGRAQSTARIRALESALRQLGERGDALAATAVPTIDEGESPALATARAHWIAERIAARALVSGTGGEESRNEGHTFPFSAISEAADRAMFWVEYETQTALLKAAREAGDE